MIKVYQYHDGLIPIKLKLNWIGYGEIQITNYFGKFTEKAVRKFQDDYDLPVTGLIDHLTVSKLNNLFLSIGQPDGISYDIEYLKKSLNRAGFGGIRITNKLGDFTENRIKEFQDFYGLPLTGVICLDVIKEINNILASPLQLGSRSQEVILLKRNLNQLGYGRIMLTPKFGKLAERRLREFQDDFDLPVNGIADKYTLEKINNALKNVAKTTYINYDLSFEDALNIQMKARLKDVPSRNVEFNDWMQDNKKLIENSLDPRRFINDKKQQFQFLDLTKPKVVTVDILNKYLKGKGLLEGKGQLFIDAGHNHGISEIYLILHAIIYLNQNLLYEKSQVNQAEKVEGLPTESLFRTMEKDATWAYDKIWETPEKVINKIVDNIKNEYLQVGKYTFYDMIWNPTAMVGGQVTKKESDDYMASVSRQIDMIHYLYQKLETYVLYLAIPVYKEHTIKIS